MNLHVITTNTAITGILECTAHYALCYLPGKQSIEFLNKIINEERFKGELDILAIFGSAAIPAFMTCLQRKPQQLWIFTLFRASAN